ncbi:hypothetical protein [Microvirga ossetica]|nr:hypothetical protein [Microvirga ossetica]
MIAWLGSEHRPLLPLIQAGEAEMSTFLGLSLATKKLPQVG